MEALKTFEPALKRGEIAVQRGDVHSDVLVHFDRPNGETRWTYVKVSGGSVTAMAIIIPAEPFKGKPVFQIGYAVPQHLRKRGAGKAITQAALDEFTAGMTRNGIKSFFFEAIVGVKNIGSQMVAAAIIGGPTKEVSDEHFGEAALQYMREVCSD